MKESKHSKYLGEFKMAADGKYVYMGKSFTLTDKDDFKKLCAIWLCTFASVIGSGFINAAGLNNSFYVIIPYIGEVICIFALSWQVVRLVWNKGVLKEYYYNKFINNVPAASAILCFFSAAGFIASTVFMILHGFEGKAAQCIVYLVLKLVSAALGAVIYRLFKALEWSSDEDKHNS